MMTYTESKPFNRSLAFPYPDARHLPVPKLQHPLPPKYNILYYRTLPKPQFRGSPPWCTLDVGRESPSFRAKLVQPSNLNSYTLGPFGQVSIIDASTQVAESSMGIPIMSEDSNLNLKVPPNPRPQCIVLVHPNRRPSLTRA